MTWGAVAGAAIGVVGSALTKDDGGGGGQSVSKDPWGAVVPWLQANINQGQALQNRYTAQPFSPTQQRAYGQQFANSDYMRTLMNAVNSQQGGNRPFNRGAPGMVPQRYRLPSAQPGMQNMGLGPSYGSVASIFNNTPVAPISTGSQGGQLTEEELANLRKIIQNGALGPWRSGEGDGSDGAGGDDGGSGDY